MDDSNAQRPDDLITDSSEPAVGTARTVVQRSYRKRLQETLKQAIHDGYSGVDVVHLEMQYLDDGSRLDIWQAAKWETEPERKPDDGCYRFDFRYYDHEKLLASLSRGEWPNDL